MAKVELEKMFEVWCENWHYEIGRDREGLGCIEIRYYDGICRESKHSMSFGKEEAALIVKAMSELL